MLGRVAEVHGRDAGQCVWRWQAGAIHDWRVSSTWGIVRPGFD